MATAPHYIREWREYRHLTQDQLAERVGMSRANVSKVERFKRPFTQGTLALFADRLGIEPRDLLAPPPTPDAPLSEFERAAIRLRKASPRLQKQAGSILMALLDDTAA